MGEPLRTTPVTGFTGAAEPVPFTTNKMGDNLMGTAAVQQFTEVKEIVSPPVVSTTQNPVLAPGAMGGMVGMATPCHPVTGATGPYPKAAPIGNTTTAYPGTTTFEQTSGLPTSTHMYGVPLATYQKGPGGVIPVATSATGPLGPTGAPVSQTFVETTPTVTSYGTTGMNTGDVLRTTTTHVSDAYTPIGTTTGTGAKGVVSATPIPDNLGVHHHDRSHHHHVHDRLPVTGGLGSGMASTTVPAPTVSGATTTGGLGSGASTAKAKAVGDREHQIIQDVIPPGRNRVVEHHEKY